MRRSILWKMNVWSEDEEYALALSFVHVRAESTIVYFLVPDFWDRVKDRFDGEIIFVAERTKDQILLKWGKMASVLEKFQRIYSRLMGTGCLVDVRIDEAAVAEACAEYARVYGRPFAKLAIWRLLTVN